MRAAIGGGFDGAGAAVAGCWPVRSTRNPARAPAGAMRPPPPSRPLRPDARGRWKGWMRRTDYVLHEVAPSPRKIEPSRSVA